MPNEKKDGWDKIEVLTKVFSGIVLVIIGFIIKAGADKIAQANEESQIIQKMIEDLTANSTSRNDIALMTLEHYLIRENNSLIEESDKKFLANIAKTIVNDQMSRDSNLISENAFSLAILKKYDSVWLNQKLQEQVAKKIDKNTPKELKDSIDDQLPIGNTTPGEAAAISVLDHKLVYIQYADPEAKSSIKLLQDSCNKRGWSAPGIEKVSGSYGYVIKYFNPSDEAFAKSLKDVAYSLLKKTFRVLPAPSSKNYSVPQGQIEIWVGK